MNSTFQFRYNKTKSDCATIEEAKEEAQNLVQPHMPWEAKVVELDENGEFIRTVVTYNSTNAR